MIDPEREEFLRKALLYAADSCVRSEQCESDIRTKLRRRQLSDAEASKIIDYLREHRYLSNERFARAYVRTKSKLSGWGPWKIRQALAAKGIEQQIISTAMAEETEEEQFEKKAFDIGRKKAAKTDITTPAGRAQFYRFMSSRGFSAATISKVLSMLGAEADDDEPDDAWEE